MKKILFLFLCSVSFAITAQEADFSTWSDDYPNSEKNMSVLITSGLDDFSGYEIAAYATNTTWMQGGVDLGSVAGPAMGVSPTVIINQASNVHQVNNDGSASVIVYHTDASLDEDYPGLIRAANGDDLTFYIKWDSNTFIQISEIPDAEYSDGGSLQTVATSFSVDGAPLMFGCTDSDYMGYDPSANAHVQADCGDLIIAGCVDSDACNFNPSANQDDSSCVFADDVCEECDGGVVDLRDADGDGYCDLGSGLSPEEVLGSQDPTACNYSPLATEEDNSGVYADDVCEVCEDGAVALYDADGDEYCDLGSGLSPEEVLGCLDSTAKNFVPNATEDDGSCYPFIFGCTNPSAWNFNDYDGDGESNELTGDLQIDINTDDGSCSYQVGDLAHGGIVFYVDETGQHGLVAALEDLGQFEWGCKGTTISGADGQAIGTGYQNTLDIVAGCSQTPIAASEALAYESEGYSDWYIPSRGELKEMYNTIGNGGPEGNIGGFESYWYWSSSERTYASAWLVNFDNGYTTSSGKYNTYRVRVIRAF